MLSRPIHLIFQGSSGGNSDRSAYPNNLILLSILHVAEFVKAVFRPTFHKDGEITSSMGDGRDHPRMTFRVYGWHDCSPTLINTTKFCYFSLNAELIISLRFMTAAAGSSAEQTAETTARQSAPAWTTVRALNALIPPMATSGWRLKDLIF